MANEFIARNGLIAKASSVISGSLTVTNGNIDGNFVGTINGGTILSGTGTNNYLTIWSGTNSVQASNIYITGGNVGIGTTSPTAKLHVVGDAYIDGTLTAQEFRTEYVTQTIIYESGSTAFGNSADDTHIFTGSLDLDGDATVTGNVTATAFIGDGSQLTGVTASASAGGTNGQVQFNSSGALAGASSLFYNSTNGRIGIGTTTPTVPVHIDAASGGFLGSTISGANGVYFNNSSGNLTATVGGNVVFTLSKLGFHNFQSTNSMALSVTTQYTGTVTDYSNVVYLLNNTAGQAASILLGANPAGSIADAGGVVKLNAVDDGGDMNARQGKFSVSIRDVNTWSEVMTLDKTGALTATSFIGDGSQLTNLPSGVTPAGSDGNLQYKSGAGLAATSTLTYDTVNGRLGIGTATPGSTLTVAGDARLSNGGKLYLWNDHNVNYIDYTKWQTSASGGLTIENQASAGHIKLVANSNTGVYINNNGYVGVGTTSLISKFHVSGGWVTIQPQYGSGGGGSRALTVNNPNDADFPVEGLTAYNTVTGFTIFNKEAYGLYGRPAGTSISTYTNAGPYTVVDSRFVNLDSTTTAPLHTWTFYQWDGAGDAVTDFKAPDLLWRVGYWNGNTRQLLNLDGAGKLYVLDGATPGTTPVQVATRTWVSTQLAGYTVVESDTLNTVTGRGNTTTNAITVGGLTVDTDTLHVDATNNRVGIGTTTPTARLQVAGDIYGTGHIRIEDAGDRLEFVNSNVHITRSGNEMYLAAYNGWRFYDMQSSATRMLLTTAGNLGIGTATASEKLQVVGNAYISGVGNRLYFDTTNGLSQVSAGVENDYEFHMFNSRGNSARFVLGNSNISLGTNTVKLFYINTANGNVGLGTTSPGGQLDIQYNSTGNVLSRVWNTNTSGTGSSSLRIANSSNSNDGARLEFTDSTYYVGTISGDRTQGLVFRTSATGTSPILINEAMRITTTGNVGIGLTNPATKLQVYGAIRGYGLGHYFGNYLTSHSNAVIGAFANSATDIPVVAKGTTSQSADLMRWVDVNNTVLGAVNWGGAFGIGTGSPTEMLHVYGTALFDYFGSGTLRIKGSTLEFYDAINILRPLNAGTGTLSLGFGAVTWDTVDVLSNAFTFNGNDIATQAWVQAQGYGSGAATGTGTTNYVTKWTGTSTLGSSVIYDNGTKVGIGTTSPAYKLTVQSSDNVNSVFRDANGNALAIRVSSGKVDLLSTYLSSVTDMDISFTPTTNAGVQTEAMRIKATGNVGIGTTNPQAKFHVYNGHVLLEDGYSLRSGGSYGASLIGRAVGAASAISVGSGQAGDYLVLNSGGNERVRIDTSGNVGIGTTSPSRKLEVQGDFYVNGTNGVLTTENSLSNLYMLNLTRTPTSLTTAGNVGIGTTSPASKLHVAGDVTVDGILTAQEFRTEYITQTVIFESGSTAFGNTDDDTHEFTGTLNVNGSAIPHLAVKSDAGQLPAIFLSRGDGTYSNNANSTWYLANSDNGLEIAAGDRADGSTARNVQMQFDNSGNVGIGTTSPSQKLSVYGNIYLRGGDYITWANGDAQIDSISYNLRFLTYDGTSALVERMRITSGGNVGIGTTSPASESNLTLGAKSASEGGHLTLQKGTSASNATHIDNFGNTFRIMGGSDTASGGVQFLLDHTTGNVGIGTTSPAYRLEVQGSSAGSHRMRIINTSTGQSSVDLKTSQQETRIIAVNNKPFYVYDQTQSAELFTILSSGNIGIGTTNPLEKLDVAGAIKLSSQVANVVTNGIAHHTNGYVYFTGGTAGAAMGNDSYSSAIYAVDNGSLELYAGSANRLHITSGGNVGIGTTSPGQKLHVVGDAWINRPSNKVDNNVATEFGSRVEFNNAFATNQSGYMVFRYPTYNNFLIGGDYDGNIGGGIPNIQFGRSNGTVYMHIDAHAGTGNVGIGNTTPGYKLDVTGDINFTGTLKYGGTTVLSNAASDVYGNIRVLYSASSIADGMYINYNSTGGTAADLRLFANGQNERVRIKADTGNVGIGTTSPTQKLEVSGNILASKLGVGGALNATYDLYNNGTTYLNGATVIDANLGIVGTTTSDGNIVPSAPGTHDLGQADLRWRTVFCDILDSAGVHESNLASDNIEDLATGTVLVWKNGKNVPSTVEGDHMRMGVAVNGISSPLVQGAEPVLCTGTINEGDYLITSDVAGHAKGISRAEMLERNLYDCVLGKALESGSGQSYLLKTWITI